MRRRDWKSQKIWSESEWKRLSLQILDSNRKQQNQLTPKSCSGDCNARRRSHYKRWHWNVREFWRSDWREHRMKCFQSIFLVASIWRYTIQSIQYCMTLFCNEKIRFIKNSSNWWKDQTPILRRLDFSKSNRRRNRNWTIRFMRMLSLLLKNTQQSDTPRRSEQANSWRQRKSMKDFEGT